MHNSADAERARERLHGTVVEGRKIEVCMSFKKSRDTNKTIKRINPKKSVAGGGYMGGACNEWCNQPCWTWKSVFHRISCKNRWTSSSQPPKAPFSPTKMCFELRLFSWVLSNAGFLINLVRSHLFLCFAHSSLVRAQLLSLSLIVTFASNSMTIFCYY